MQKKSFYFWRRSFAFLIDVFILYLLTYPLQQSIARKIELPNNFSELVSFLMNPELLAESKNYLLFLSIAIAVIALAYWTILEFTLKQSIGKMVFKLKVESKRMSQCILRNLSKAFFFVDILFFVFLIDVVYSIFHKEHLRIFESWSKTKVVKK